MRTPVITVTSDETQAELLKCAELSPGSRIGDSERARESWQAACRYLGGYGFRKDVTIYEIIESVSALGSSTSLAQGAFRPAEPVQSMPSISTPTEGKRGMRSLNGIFTN